MVGVTPQRFKLYHSPPEASYIAIGCLVLSIKIAIDTIYIIRLLHLKWINEAGMQPSYS